MNLHIPFKRVQPWAHTNLVVSGINCQFFDNGTQNYSVQFSGSLGNNAFNYLIPTQSDWRFA